MPEEIVADNLSEERIATLSSDQVDSASSMYSQTMAPPYRQTGTDWRVVGWSIFSFLGATVLVAVGWFIFSTSPDQAAQAEQPALVVELSPTPVATPTATPTATPQATSRVSSGAFTFPEATPVPTTVPGGQVVILTPEEQAAGWVVSDDETIVSIYDPQNNFGDSFLYAGVLDEQIYHAAFQFDLSSILRGTEILDASLRLTGLRADLLNQENQGVWWLHMLSAELDPYWNTANYQQIHNAGTWVTFEPALAQAQLGSGQINLFQFTPDQLDLLETRLLGSGKVSFRLDGPVAGDNNLFAWDTGFGPASQGQGPELFLNLGSPPQETPTPNYVVITSTPTPENVMTAAAISLQLTAEATRIGTATPLPPNWVTPALITATPTPENEATAQVMGQEATAIALTTGIPSNFKVVTDTPTPAFTPTPGYTPRPTYIVITSTPTPENVMTAAAISQRITAEAAQFGTATPLPPYWATPIVVTSTPTPGNEATAQSLHVFATAVALTTGTPTPTPNNVQTATPTPISIAIDPLIVPVSTPTPEPTPQPIPASLLGKIAFLSDREATEEEPVTAYVFDPETEQLGRLTAPWPYDVALAREPWSADERYRVFTKDAIRNSLDPDSAAERVPALFVFDYLYEAEWQLTEFGAGIAYGGVWSPTAEQIAFVSNDSSDDEIWVVNHDGSKLRQLTSSNEAFNAREIGKDTFIPEINKHPTWSPDGDQIVFYSNRSGNFQLWIMNRDGSQQRLLMDWTPYNDWDPVWIKTLDPAPVLPREPR